MKSRSEIEQDIEAIMILGPGPATMDRLMEYFRSLSGDELPYASQYLREHVKSEAVRASDRIRELEDLQFKAAEDELASAAGKAAELLSSINLRSLDKNDQYFVAHSYASLKAVLDASDREAATVEILRASTAKVRDLITDLKIIQAKTPDSSKRIQ